MKKRTAPAEKEPAVCCAQCRFVGTIEDVVCCKRYPPVVIYLVATDSVESHFPVITPTDCCGEWAAKLNS